MLQNNKNDNWDLIILSEDKLFSLGVKNIYNYRDLLWQFIKRDFLAFYKQTFLGPLWFFIQPIFTVTVYIFLFSNLAHISTDGIPAPLFYLSGIAIWSYFSECFIKTSTVFRDNIHIFGKVYFPRIVVPLGIMVSNLLKFIIQLILLSLMTIYYQFKLDSNISVSAYILLFPLLILCLAACGLGFGLIVSSLTTRYRDLALLINFGMQLFMYASPVVYPISSLNGTLYKLILCNPLTIIIEGFRLAFFNHGYFDFGRLLYLIFFSFIIMFLGLLFFNKSERNFVDTI